MYKNIVIINLISYPYKWIIVIGMSNGVNACYHNYNGLHVLNVPSVIIII